VAASPAVLVDVGRQGPASPSTLNHFQNPVGVPPFAQERWGIFVHMIRCDRPGTMAPRLIQETPPGRPSRRLLRSSTRSEADAWPPAFQVSVHRGNEPRGLLAKSLTRPLGPRKRGKPFYHRQTEQTEEEHGPAIPKTRLRRCGSAVATYADVAGTPRRRVPITRTL